MHDCFQDVLDCFRTCMTASWMYRTASGRAGLLPGCTGLLQDVQDSFQDVQDCFRMCRTASRTYFSRIFHILSHIFCICSHIFLFVLYIPEYSCIFLCLQARGLPFCYFKFEAKHAKPDVQKDPETDMWTVPTQLFLERMYIDPPYGDKSEGPPIGKI